MEIKTCEGLRKEIAAVFATEGWQDIIQKPVSACLGCRSPRSETRSPVSAGEADGCDNYCSLGCIGQVLPSAETTSDRTCAELLAGRVLCDLLTRQGALVVTPGQVARWRQAPEGTDFPRWEGAAEDTALGKVILLESGVDPAAPENVRALAQAMGVPWEIVPVGLEHLRLVLRDRVRALYRERGAVEAEGPGCAILRTSERKYRSLFEASPISLWEVDLSRAKAFVDRWERDEGGDFGQYVVRHPDAAGTCADLLRLLDVNRATLELFQVKEKEKFLDRPERYLDREFLRVFRKGLVALALGKSTFVGEGRHRPEEGEERLLQVCLSVVPDYEISLEMVIVSVVDVTERRRVETALEQIHRVQSEFMSTAAHELRTPLTAILGFTELLLNPETVNGIGADQRQDYLSIIYEKAEALHRIVDDLHDLSRIEAGQPIPLRKAACRMQPVIEEVMERFRRENPDHLYELDLPEGIDAQEVDRERIVQVLENLLSNAVKYSPDGTLVRLVGEIGEKGLELSVEDQGIGMDREQSRKAFDTFYRADASNTAVQGLGLGMCIAKNVVAAHGGRIWVKSQQGLGTKVTFTLPSAAG